MGVQFKSYLLQVKAKIMSEKKYFVIFKWTKIDTKIVIFRMLKTIFVFFPVISNQFEIM